MATFLFWNIYQKPLVRQIAALCHERDVDVLILAESEITKEKLLRELNEGSPSPFVAPADLSPRLSFFRRGGDLMLAGNDIGGVAIRRFVPTNGLAVLIVAVHLRSKVYRNDQAFHSRQVVHAIREAEHIVGHRRTVVVGDLNMDPFEQGVVSADGLHAVMDRCIARKGGRTVQGEYFDFFYNPMWGRMGDTSKGPPGTYYHSGSGPVSYFWNTFDQVILRPDLLEYFSDERLEVVTAIEGRSLLTVNGRPKKSRYSDHLPLVFSLDIERSV